MGFRRRYPKTQEERKHAVQWERLLVRIILDGDDGFVYEPLHRLDIKKRYVITAYFNNEYLIRPFKPGELYVITAYRSIARLRRNWERNGWLPHASFFCLAPMVKYGS